MLSNQINVNLELRDQCDATSQQLQAEKEKTLTLECKLNEAEVNKILYRFKNHKS